MSYMTCIRKTTFRPISTQNPNFSTSSTRTTKNFDEHIQTFEKLFVEIAARGSAMSDENKVGHLLRSLPDSLSNIASVAGTMQLSDDDVCSTVKAEIDRRDSRKMEDKTKNDTDTITPRKSIAKHRGAGSNTQCYCCKTFGHFLKDCRKSINDYRDRGRVQGRGGGFRHQTPAQHCGYSSGQAEPSNLGQQFPQLVQDSTSPSQQGRQAKDGNSQYPPWRSQGFMARSKKTLNSSRTR